MCGLICLLLVILMLLGEFVFIYAIPITKRLLLRWFGIETLATITEFV